MNNNFLLISFVILRIFYDSGDKKSNILTRRRVHKGGVDHKDTIGDA